MIEKQIIFVAPTTFIYITSNIKIGEVDGYKSI